MYKNIAHPAQSFETLYDFTMTEQIRQGENLADETKIGTEAGTDSKKTDAAQKRMRVKRIKTAIIITMIFLFLLPTVLCIIFGIQLNRLQRQVDTFFSTYSDNTDDKDRKSISGKYAYASTDENVVKGLDKLDKNQDDSAHIPLNNIDERDNPVDGGNIDYNSDPEEAVNKIDAGVVTGNPSNKPDGSINQDVSVIEEESDIDIVDASDIEEETDIDIVGASDIEEGLDIDNASDIQEGIDIGEGIDSTKASDSTEATEAPDSTKATEAPDTTEASDTKVTTDIVSDTQIRIPWKIYREKTQASSQESKDTSTERYRDPNGIYYDKKVYLTFDDGPTKHTDKILDILAEYNIKATFFVVGREDDLSKERYKRILKEGHVLAIHSYSHKYSYIYKSLENFDKDFTKLWNLLYDTTGYTPSLYRFPGGSLGMLSKSKMKEYVKYLNEKGMTYFDWNVVNGDAEGIDYTEKQMINNVLNGVAQKKTSIVLMHDGEGKDKTVATLPKILDALVSGGAELLPLDETAPLIQQIKASSLN